MHYHTSHSGSLYSYPAVTVSLDVGASPISVPEGSTRQVCVSVSQNPDGGRACPLDIGLSAIGYGTKQGEHGTKQGGRGTKQSGRGTRQGGRGTPH